MLAYVFWHWARPELPAGEYEALQRRFHTALAAAPSPGFLASCSGAIAGVPWAAAGGPAYEDWYLLDGSAALDPLNQAAVSASRQAPHDAAAAAAADGTAGLYLRRLGPGIRPGDGWVATWFAKPAALSYHALYGLLRPLVDARSATLWGRQMVLGPSPEFCLQTAVPVPLPAPLAGTSVTTRTVWP